MKIVVCVKQVPDTKGGVKFNPMVRLTEVRCLPL